MFLNFTDRKTKIFFFKCDTFIFKTSAFSEVDYNRSRTGTNVLKRIGMWNDMRQIFPMSSKIEVEIVTENVQDTTIVQQITLTLFFPSAGQVYPHILVINQSNNKKLQIPLLISLCMWMSVTFHLCCIAEHSLLFS